MTFKIFIAGDLHIPSRATMLHPKFQAILQDETWDFIVLTGDLTTTKVLKSFQKFLSDSNHLIACRGNMDKLSLPLRPTFNVEGLLFGVFHGTGIYPRGDISQLKAIAREMKVKVLCTGHSHQTFVHKDEEHLILNPGTATGASGGSSWTVDTAVMILSVTSHTKINSYELTLDWYQISPKGKLSCTTKGFQL
ncbi:MAG: YfcE family phosphodiesterase [Candidatus Heimdallarchaeota archaeon]|nr:YfcE family phosphodiesterase [Candidatus Heimdallarchaeota archaeon]